jgi:hypothetical protein
MTYKWTFDMIEFFFFNLKKIQNVFLKNDKKGIYLF